MYKQREDSKNWDEDDTTCAEGSGKIRGLEVGLVNQWKYNKNVTFAMWYELRNNTTSKNSNHT
jgi:hypothetical protein